MATIEAERPTQRDEALRSGDEIRLRRAQVKRDLRAGTMSVAAALEDPALASALLIDVIRWTRMRRGSVARVADIGRLALRDGVNLMLTVDAAGERTRRWVAEHGRHGLRWADGERHGAPRKVARS